MTTAFRRSPSEAEQAAETMVFCARREISTDAHFSKAIQPFRLKGKDGPPLYADVLTRELPQIPDDVEWRCDPKAAVRGGPHDEILIRLVVTKRLWTSSGIPRPFRLVDDLREIAESMAKEQP